MEYVQERISTFHDYGGADPSAPVDQATVVVPLAERDQGSPATEGVLRTLESVDPGRVLVPLRAAESAVGEVAAWLESFDLDLTVLWCTAPAVESLLADHGLDGAAGKGRDVWLGLGVAGESPYVAVHDADALTYDRRHVPKLLAPLAEGYDFTKGYYARVEDQQLYGRLFRLFYRPLISALSEASTAEFVTYLGSFRYALAGEFATTGDLAHGIRAPRGWGLELGTLGDAFDHAGFSGSAQVDLGIHEHEHRSVEGSGGLGEMCDEVAATLFTVIEERGLDPDYDRLRAAYRDHATRLVRQYAGDASFNGFEYDPQREREQIDTYAPSVSPPGEDTRLPAWEETALAPNDVLARSETALAQRR
ncbi:glycosyl transferase family 2 [Halovenus sp. WSH3]|uniref:Glycosyl transferase family 2 n=1 Tax=Halovenus carboxidivorans TaxID=2692199 RepID=A0A6B0TAK1_9EURY|nr:glycosyl transferase family 2 [Halovenus carboxidivorans]MXR52412.1 glycosyl transferase family 2 [Halovenus carboxidivorans]